MSFPWLDDSLNEDESRAVNSLRYILREAPAVAETLVSLQWLADGVTEDESWTVRNLQAISTKDPRPRQKLCWASPGLSTA